MKFELEETLRGASDEEILDDLRRVAKLLRKETLTASEYRQSGNASSGTIVGRFGSWNNGLEKAGLKVKFQRNISDDDLFENLERMWIELGRQPRYSEVKFPFSRFSNVTYDKRFGRFSEALKQFVVWVNSDRLDEPQESTDAKGMAHIATLSPLVKRRSRREISDRQRFRILVRDGFRCKACGASPLKQSGIELHVDHILPWSKGGETTDDNLESKCKQCNLGKGNAFDA
jgi:Homing endonuclease associated repeat/HNH endonuclease